MRNIKLALASSIVIVAIGMMVFHFMIMPVDTLWFVTLRRLGI